MNLDRCQTALKAIEPRVKTLVGEGTPVAECFQGYAIDRLWHLRSKAPAEALTEGRAKAAKDRQLRSLIPETVDSIIAAVDDIVDEEIARQDSKTFSRTK